VTIILGQSYATPSLDNLTVTDPTCLSEWLVKNGTQNKKAKIAQKQK